jgi:hypothetical protein
MDVIRETGFYTTQLETNTLKTQAERQLSFANTWLNFVRKKKSLTNTLKSSTTLPMWLLPGIHFLRHVCLLQFTNHVNDELFGIFHGNMQKTINYLNNPNIHHDQKHVNTNIRSKKSSKPSQVSSSTKHGYDKQKKKKIHLTRIEQIELLDRKIDRQRFKEGLIGKIKQYDERTIKMPTISKRMEQDLAYLKIRNFHKLNLLSRGQFATSMCRIFQSKGS